MEWTWIDVASPLAAGAFALVGAWLGSKLQKHQSYSEYWREQRQGAYLALLAVCQDLEPQLLRASEGFFDVAEMSDDDMNDLVATSSEVLAMEMVSRQVAPAVARVRLVGGSRVATEASGVQDWFEEVERDLQIGAELVDVAHRSELDRAKASEFHGVIDQSTEVLSRRTKWLLQAMRDDLGPPDDPLPGGRYPRSERRLPL